MNDLASIAEGVLREHLLKVARDIVAMDLMEEDPECQLLSDPEWNKVASMIADATINVKVIVH